jgi:ATP/maltotriose-dependent transcriptional regulator MalT/DNA-binding SARP family transcriptional activator
MATRRDVRTVWCRLDRRWDRAHDLVGLAFAGTGSPAEIADVELLGLADQLLELLEAEPTTLVIDDYDVGRLDELDPLLAEVLALVPDGAKLIITSRSRPAGLFGRAPSGALDLVDPSMLRLSDDDAVSLFAARGRDADVALDWCRHTDGWAAALAVAADSGLTPTGSDPTQLFADLVLDRATGADRELLEALIALPYLTGELAQALALGRPDDLTQMGSSTAGVIDEGGFYRLHPALRSALEARVDGQDLAGLRERAASALRASDPETAIDLLMAAGAYETATDVLAASLSSIGPDRAVGWLYELPAELRHRLPPLLAGGRATVDTDAAVADARRRVRDAATGRERSEALLALGSLQSSVGELSEAADSLERALAGAGSEALLRTRATTLLGLVRYFAGDLVGARSALEAAGERVWAMWGLGQLALAEGDLDEAERCAAACIELAPSEAGATAAPGLSVAALVALCRGSSGPEVEARARQAYEIGLATGGHDLACGATAHAWHLTVAGQNDEALAVCDLLDRRVARNDHHARLQAELVRLAVARACDDGAAADRAARRVGELRGRGYGPPVAVAERALPVLGDNAPRTVVVRVLGALEVSCGARTVRLSDWKSKKACEVLVYLAHRGPARREQVIEAVWPDRPPDKGRTLLRTALSEIRRVLEPSRAAGQPSAYLVTTGTRVEAAATTDLAETERLVANGRLDEAFGLLASDPDLDTDAEWADDLRREVERTRIEVAERLANDPTSLHRPKALETLVEAEPWKKEHYDQLAELHRSEGDDAAASAVERKWFESDD